ncbi:RlmE family RNA methyltransferase [Enterovirga rhinocerotis]|uniref:Ribosomal RNA large subunit methyltransferase E n=1 Tax=Enterovirga rhinocerotis TaxID=1339210 RepID=A0A4V6PZM4_9HYPH|nr:RlmE family RNA methyltransferase [Enterovirga rhinocerotis]TDR93259.1 23S rRNA Um-2552 2'-O-methyltransferase [Enterovirga rhinocerotis]
MSASERGGRGAGAGGKSAPGRQKVRKGGNRTPSQRAWLERQLNDPYVARAKREGYRSRAAFKLIEIDDKYRLLKPGGRVIDLGAAPGGWAQVAAARVGRATGRGRVVGIDLLPIDPLPGIDLIELDFMADEAPDRLRELLDGEADLVMSDMAANATGHRKTDHLKIMGLAEAAAEFARAVLAPGGAYLAKVLQGGTENTLLADLKRDFAVVRHVKPAASRSDSAELYVLATGFRGRADSPASEPSED